MSELANEITFLHPVKMPLTDREIIAYVDEFSALDQQFKEVSLKHESEVSAFKSTVKEIEKEQSRILSLMTVKEEFKDVECVKDFDYFEGIVTIKRADNGETVTTRKMTPDEYKRPLPFNDANTDDPENKDDR